MVFSCVLLSLDCSCEIVAVAVFSNCCADVGFVSSNCCSVVLLMASTSSASVGIWLWRAAACKA